MKLISIEVELVDEAKKFYKLYSIWFFALIGLLPDLYNLAVQDNLITGGIAPALLVRMINIVAFVGAASRLVKQKVAAEEADPALAASAAATAISDLATAAEKAAPALNAAVAAAAPVAPTPVAATPAVMTPDNAPVIPPAPAPTVPPTA